MRSLSDVMSHAGLAGYAEVGLILFFAVFVAILIRVMRPSQRQSLERNAELPLHEPAARRGNGVRP